MSTPKSIGRVAALTLASSLSLGATFLSLKGAGLNAYVVNATTVSTNLQSYALVFAWLFSLVFLGIAPRAAHWPWVIRLAVGTLAGYIAAAASYQVSVMLAPDGLQRIQNAIDTHGLLTYLLVSSWYPLLMFGWLYGLIAVFWLGLFQFILDRLEVFPRPQ